MYRWTGDLLDAKPGKKPKDTVRCRWTLAIERRVARWPRVNCTVFTRVLSRPACVVCARISAHARPKKTRCLWADDNAVWRGHRRMLAKKKNGYFDSARQPSSSSVDRVVSPLDPFTRRTKASSFDFVIYLTTNRSLPLDRRTMSHRVDRIFTWKLVLEPTNIHRYNSNR